MADIEFLTKQARDMQMAGSSESHIKNYLYKNGLNEFQASSILAALEPVKIAGKEDEYIQLRRGIKLRRWQIVIAARVVAFILGAAMILGIVFNSSQTGAPLSNSIVLFVFAGILILFSSGLLDKWL